MKYRAGASKKCDFILCCREANGFPRDKAKRAGRLGNYGCDVPFDLITTMGEYINNNIHPEVVFWTGDNVPHNMWEEKSYRDKFVYSEVLTDFVRANLSYATVYPLFGNHDFEISNL